MKKGFHPLDHGFEIHCPEFTSSNKLSCAFARTTTRIRYDRYLGLPESNDYGCTDTQMGAPDAGCSNWTHDRCPRNSAEAMHPPPYWDKTSCHPGPINPWNYSIPLLLDRKIIEQPADLDGSRTGTSVSFKYARFAAEFIANATAREQPFFVYIAWSHMHVPVVHSRAFTHRSALGPLGDSLMELDAAAGQVLQALENAGATNDTLVILTGDNGECMCDTYWG